MQFSENWLRTYADPDLNSRDLAHALTMAGLEVEKIEPVAPAFDKVAVAEVLSVAKHPQAERLSICQVNVGKEKPLTIVCGAPNLRSGMRVACAQVGARLPGMEIREEKIRDVPSQGMLCSEKELGLSGESDGLLILPQDAPVGKAIRSYLELEDSLLTLKLTPNRGDCLSIMGIAREVAAITGCPARFPPVHSSPVKTRHALGVRVEARAQSACPRYCGRIIQGIRIKGTTPQWMARRLNRSGVRSINAIVDITNHVMLETGQPLHAFDLAKVEKNIVVRFAKPNETLTLLNGEKAQLQPDMLVIADALKPLALAGVMGGVESSVTDATRDIFLESAFFSPEGILGKTRRLGLESESSHRFERGVDFASTRTALERATQLVLEICGGVPGPISEAKSKLPPRKPIRLRVERIQKVLGTQVKASDVARVFKRLRMECLKSENTLRVSPPSYRFDLSIEEDLIEEFARIHGYDNIEGSLPHVQPTMLPHPEQTRDATRIRDGLVSRDYQEIISYAFVDEAWEQDFCANTHPVRLQNPIASHMDVMRSSLIGGLIACLRFNLNRSQTRIRLFEIGCCFEARGKGFHQPEKVGGLSYGEQLAEQWGIKTRSSDFFDVKSDIEALAYPLSTKWSAFSHPALHPGRAAKIHGGGIELGWVGELHPKWQQKYDLALAPVLFELDFEALCRCPVPKAQEISRLPRVRRDIAVVVEGHLSAGELLEALRMHAPAVVHEVALFDMYAGKGIEPGKKSLAFRVLMQDTHRTLTDAKADSVIAHLTEILSAKYNAKLRSS